VIKDTLSKDKEEKKDKCTIQSKIIKINKNMPRITTNVTQLKSLIKNKDFLT
jgi:hypothetical protein